jgi:outer membrane protein assembly factor BamB
MAGVGVADDWPQFRGPCGDGTSSAKNLPITWGPKQNVLWRTSVPGRGRSSPVILADRVWLTTAEDSPASPELVLAKLNDLPDSGGLYVADQVILTLVCLNRTSGALVYEKELFRVNRPVVVHQMNSFATPTPVVEPGRVYCDFGSMGTACVEAATGRVLWKVRLPAVNDFLGPGSSPVVTGERLVLVRDGCDLQYVAALEKTSGKLAWRTARPPIDTSDPQKKKAYSTPLTVDGEGKTQVVVPGAQWVCAYDVATGRELWRVRHGEGYSLAPRPVAGHGMVFACTGCNSPELWAIRLGGRGDVTDTHVAWKAKSGIPMMSSPLLVDREIYCVSDDGIVSCFDALSGKTLWRKRIGGKHLASPLYADGKLYFFNLEGRATVLASGRTPAVLAENELDGPLAATPAIAAGALFVRTDSHLYCVRSAR